MTGHMTSCLRGYVAVVVVVVVVVARAPRRRLWLRSSRSLSDAARSSAMARSQDCLLGSSRPLGYCSDLINTTRSSHRDVIKPRRASPCELPPPSPPPSPLLRASARVVVHRRDRRDDAVRSRRARGRDDDDPAAAAAPFFRPLPSAPFLSLSLGRRVRVKRAAGEVRSCARQGDAARGALIFYRS